METNFFFLATGPAGTPLAIFQEQFGSFYLVSLAVMVLIVWLIIYGALGLKARISEKSLKQTV